MKKLLATDIRFGLTLGGGRVSAKVIDKKG
jgi:hypothetical protein